MNFTELIQPKSNPFRLFIYTPYQGTINLKTFSSEKISSAKLSTYQNEGTYCNSYRNLYLSSGSSFWSIAHNSYQIKYKKMPVQKKNHSMIFIPNGNNEGKIFIVGGNDKKVFYYDLKKNYFINWAPTNEYHIKPALIQINDYLYIFDTVKQNNFFIERTNLINTPRKWEKIVPSCDPNLLINFPSQSFATCLDDSNTKVIFLGGNNIDMEHNGTYLYDIKNNKIYLSQKGTNDCMNFTDKTFYKIDNKYSIALPDNLEENKEIAIIDKNEQSLIKQSIEENNIYKLNINTNKTFINNKCQFCHQDLEGGDYTYNLLNKQKNLQLYNNNIDAINQNKKIKTLKKFEIKELPKEFGYCLSAYSSENAKIKAKKDNIEIIEINKYNKLNIKSEAHPEAKNIEPINQDALPDIITQPQINEEQNVEKNEELNKEVQNEELNKEVQNEEINKEVQNEEINKKMKK